MRRALIVSHRWLSLIFGLLLVIVCTSGAILVYYPEVTRMVYADDFRTTATAAPVGFTKAIEAVHRADPGFETAYVALKDGVYLLRAEEGSAGVYFVDAGTGHINGHDNLGRGVMGFLINLHDCALSCEGYTGYVPWLAKPSVVAGFGPTKDMTWASVILGGAGLVLVIVAISGIIIWYPGLRKWRNGFRVRWGKGRFARDYDLHNVIGIVAALPLLIWGLTGMNFEIPVVGKIWYSATGGQEPPDDAYDMPQTSGAGPEITLDQAMSAATAQFPGSTVTWVGLPEGLGHYWIQLLAGGPDLWAHDATYHGNRAVGVDAHDASVVKIFEGAPKTLSNKILDEWAQPALHYGEVVNGWWRSLWFLMGLTPLALMVTGLSTWLFRRSTSRRKAAARAERERADRERESVS